MVDKHFFPQGEEAAVQEIIHSRKIFVGGLTKDATDDNLREYFSKYGKVDHTHFNWF